MLYGVADVEAKIEELADELALRDFLDRQSGRLSAGQKTRVAIAKALDQRSGAVCCSTSRPPRSIPTPPIGCARVSRRIAAAHNCAILLASHNMARGRAPVRPRADAEGGRLVDDDAPAELLARYGRDTLEEVFLDVARGRAEGGAHERRSAFSLKRVGAMILRYTYLLRSSYAAHAGDDLLAAGADAHLGLSANLSRARPGGARRRRRVVAGGGHAHRRRAAVGHSAARPAGLLLLLPRGDVVAQPRPICS